jgi:hypothetical protein
LGFEWPQQDLSIPDLIATFLAVSLLSVPVVRRAGIDSS